MNPPRTFTILMADDDDDDRLLTRDAFVASRVLNELRFVTDGKELLEYLHREGRYAAPADAPRPGLILLDLNMPQVDGWQALEEIKRSPELRAIPVVVMTTSTSRRDIAQCYDLGANSFITKPVSFKGLVETIGTLGHYWCGVVELPV